MEDFEKIIVAKNLFQQVRIINNFNEESDFIEKGKSLPIDTITNGMQKIAEGKWRPVKSGNNSKSAPKVKKPQAGHPAVSGESSEGMDSGSSISQELHDELYRMIGDISVNNSKNNKLNQDVIDEVYDSMDSGNVDYDKVISILEDYAANDKGSSIKEQAIYDLIDKYDDEVDSTPKVKRPQVGNMTGKKAASSVDKFKLQQHINALGKIKEAIAHHQKAIDKSKSGGMIKSEAYQSIEDTDDLSKSEAEEILGL